MRKLGGLGIGFAALLLAGCSVSTSDAAPRPSVTEAAAPSAAPITMAPSATSTPADASEYQITEDMFLRGLGEAWHGEVPSDEQLIAAGLLACEQLRGGATEDDVRAVEGEGEDADWNNKQLVLFAIATYCVEFD